MSDSADPIETEYNLRFSSFRTKKKQANFEINQSDQNRETSIEEDHYHKSTNMKEKGNKQNI